jgi:hypothetical protein
MKTFNLALGTAVVAAAAVTAVSTSAGDASSPTHRAAPGPLAAQFDHPKANRYFPLRPGTVSRYRGTDNGERFREVVTVTYTKKTILGVSTTVVRDVLRRVDGSLAEKTFDWYAADNNGRVWYFGENTATYDEQGHLESREGSWKAGVDGASPGTIMPADPRPTEAYRQEYYRGHAEDQAWIVQRHATLTVPYGTVHEVVRSFEWTRLEPRVISVKFYASGLGIVLERDVAGGHELFKLVSVRHR